MKYVIFRENDRKCANCKQHRKLCCGKFKLPNGVIVENSKNFGYDLIKILSDLRMYKSPVYQKEYNPEKKYEVDQEKITHL